MIGSDSNTAAETEQIATKSSSDRNDEVVELDSDTARSTSAPDRQKESQTSVVVDDPETSTASPYSDTRTVGIDEDEPAEPLRSAQEVADLHAGLADLREAVLSMQMQASHRESVIDRLHAENQSLRSGEQRRILDPVSTGLMRLHRLLEDERGHTQEEGPGGQRHLSMMDVFISEVELLLEGCGLDKIEPTVGEDFQSGRHKPFAIEETQNEDEARKISAIHRAGFEDRHTGKPRRPAEVSLYRLFASGGGLERHGEEAIDDASNSCVTDIPMKPIERKQ